MHTDRNIVCTLQFRVFENIKSDTIISKAKLTLQYSIDYKVRGE